MKFSAALSSRLHWLNLPGAVLLALLQRTPAVRVAATAGEIIRAAPAGAMLRAAATSVASLGALHTLAGATELVVNTTAVNATVGTPISTVAFVTNGAPTIALSYIITGVPPGLTVPGLNPVTNILNISNPTGSGVITGTPTVAGTYPVRLQAWEFPNATGNFSPTVTVLFTITAAGATGPPTITAQPASVVTAVGLSATFSVGVTANPGATYQWLKNSIAIVGAAGSSLTIGDVKLSDAGNYTVIATNSFGSVQSATATLDVAATPSQPVFTAHPASVTVAPGSTVVLTGAAGAAPSPTYQWWRGTTQISGATGPVLVLSGADLVAGSYSLVANNVVNTVSSNAAVVTITPSTNPGRLINLSILTPLAAGEMLTMGTVIGGVPAATPAPTKALLARAAGPSLTAFNISPFLPDPQMSFIVQGAGAIIATSNDWGTDATRLTTAFLQVGAFPFASTASKDAAVFLERLPMGSYTVQVTDSSPTAAGAAIVELYDATPTAAFSASTPRLVNVSVLKLIPTGTTLTAGFVIGGTTAKTVLIRAVGPALAGAPFNIGGTMPDPQLVLLNQATGARIAENDNWGGSAQLATVGKNVGAFEIANTGSRDAMLLLTLAPGNYSAAVSPVGTGGFAIVEVYEVP